LCPNCNADRLNKNASAIIKKEENDEKERLLKEAYKIVDAREQICSGCGQVQHLSRSHIIRRSKNSDLIAEPDNIVLDCLFRINPDKFGNEGCHSRWESNNIEKMLTLNNFQERMNYLKYNDKSIYNTLLDKYNLWRNKQQQ
jgi:hypothetical protein